MASQTYRHTVEFSKNRHTDRHIALGEPAIGRFSSAVARQDRPGLPGVPPAATR